MLKRRLREITKSQPLGRAFLGDDVLRISQRDLVSTDIFTC